MLAMVPDMADTIPLLRRASVPRQRGADALVTSIAALLDRSVMRTVSYVVQRQLLPRDVDLDMLRDSIRVMLTTGLVEKPQAFFSFVQKLEKPRAANPDELRSHPVRRIKGGSVHRCALKSTWQPGRQLPRAATSTPAGDAIQFDHWRHAPGTAKGSVIVLHGFAMGWPVIDAFAMSASNWFALGFDVLLLTLPDHGSRRAPGAFFSGQSFTVPHAVQLAVAVQRTIHEIFELKRWLRAQDDKPVGLVGMSLGGYLASLCVGLSEDFDFLIALVPPACMGDLAWRVYRDTGHHRAGADEVLTERNMRAAFYVHSPLAHPRKIARERILIAAGAGDRIVPPEHPSALWEHWGRPAIHWFRGAHTSTVASRGLMRVVRGHLRQLDII
jgi:pimeloyl-ACP methyl ester carboxylesterase